MAAKKSNSTRENDYNLIVKEKIGQNTRFFMSRNINKKSIKSEVIYYSSYESLINDKHDINGKVNVSRFSSNNMPLAVYRLNYTYTPVLINFISDIKIYREVVALQEKERSQFK
jgi:hypothetical protein